MAEAPSLEGFVQYFLMQNFKQIAPVEFYDFGNVLSQVLYRDAPWQVEFVILRAGNAFPRQHRHPDVDAYEYDLSGGTPFFVNGVKPSDWKESHALVRVRSTDWHGVGDVPRGACFLSIQEWLNGVNPSAVGLNWQGTPMSLQHRAMLKQPGAKWIRSVKRYHGNSQRNSDASAHVA